MISVEDIIGLVQSIVSDSASPIPGFLTITTLARVMLSQGSLNEKEGEDEPTKKQIEYVRNLLRDHPESFELKKFGNKWYFRLKDK